MYRHKDQIYVRVNWFKHDTKLAWNYLLEVKILGDFCSQILIM